MYKLQYVNEDRNKYINTWVGVGDQLVAADEYDHLGAGIYQLHGSVLSELAPERWGTVPTVLKVRNKDMVWSPPLPTGYYNIQAKPWRCVWLSQTGTRQYKVGLNPTTMRCYTTMRYAGSKRARGEVEFVTVALAYRDGHQSQPVKRALSMIQKRTKSTLIGLSRNLALEKLGGATFVVYRCSQVVGLAYKGHLHIDKTFTHPDLNNLEYTYESAKELGTLYRISAKAD